MKKIIIFLAVFLSLQAGAQSHYTFTFDRNDFTVSTIDGVTYISAADMMDYTSTSNPDGPSLPLTTKKILNTKDYTVSSFTADVDKELIAENVTFYANGNPVTTDTPLDDMPELEFATASEMECVTLLEGNAVQNGYSFSVWAVRPFLYEADTKKLYFVSKVTLTPMEIKNLPTLFPSSTDGSEASSPVVRNDMINLEEFLNNEVAGSYTPLEDPESRSQATSEKFDYLIITSENLVSSFDELVRWKNQKGVRTKVATVESIAASNSPYTQLVDQIKYYIYGCYKDNGIKYVMLGGDTPIIPVKYCPVTISISVGVKTDTIPTDLYYACFDKSFVWDANNNGVFGERSDNVDLYPEIMLSRLPVRTQNDVHAFVGKLLKYERELPKTGFSERILFSGMELHGKFNGLSDAYLIGKNIIEKDIKPYWDGTIDMLYDTNPNSTDVFSTTAVTNYINTSYNIIDIATHGNYSIYSTGQMSTYNTINARNQHNSIPSIIITSACLTNGFDHECLSEAFIRNPSGGAVAYIGASRSGLRIISHKSNPSYDDLIQLSHLNESQFFNHLYNSSRAGYSNNLGYVYNKSKELILSKSSGSDPYLYLAYGINLMGDAEMPISTHDSKTISATIEYDKSTDEYAVKLPEEIENCAVTVTSQEDNLNVLYTVKESKNVRFPKPDRSCIITITGRNYLPFVHELIFLHLHDCIISEDTDYTAEEIIIGENVTVTSGATLILSSKTGFQILDKVKCEQGAKLVLKNI